MEVGSADFSHRSDGFPVHEIVRSSAKNADDGLVLGEVTDWISLSTNAANEAVKAPRRTDQKMRKPGNSTVCRMLKSHPAHASSLNVSL